MATLAINPNISMEEAGHSGGGGGGGGCSVTLLELPVSEDPAFDLARTVCSHGLFMMAPNHWDPSTNTLRRPLRLPSSSTTSVSISHPAPPALLITVLSAAPLSADDRHAILAQVRRMLRMSDENDRAVREFHELHPASRDRGFGRVFRSPSLFEDMVKCMLLCNCQWARTLSMAKSLCKLQLELKNLSTAEDSNPKTPQTREQKRKRGEKNKTILRSETEFVETEAESALDTYSFVGRDSESILPHESCNSSHTSNVSMVNAPVPGNQSLGDVPCPSSAQIGDFPTPVELATLKADFLAKRCGLGYRAQRIISLAQSIVEEKLLLRKLEEICDGSLPADYDEMDKKLSGISGLGSFTRANILMCMGFYHRIPADSETVRHLKQFHARRECTIRTVQTDVESIYGKYEPFQFLAYWSDLWDDYEKRFGKMSQMLPSDYKLITASNMRTKIHKRS